MGSKPYGFHNSHRIIRIDSGRGLMTDKQRIYMNQLLDQINLKQRDHRQGLIRVLANNEHRTLETISDGLASSIIWKLEFIVATQTKGNNHA